MFSFSVCVAAFLSDFQLSLGRSHSRLFFSSACFLYLFCDCLGVVFICIKALWLSDEKTRRSIFYICTCVYEEKIVVGFCVIVFRLSLSLSLRLCVLAFMQFMCIVEQQFSYIILFLRYRVGIAHDIFVQVPRWLVEWRRGRKKEGLDGYFSSSRRLKGHPRVEGVRSTRVSTSAHFLVALVYLARRR